MISNLETKSIFKNNLNYPKTRKPSEKSKRFSWRSSDSVAALVVTYTIASRLRTDHDMSKGFYPDPSILYFQVTETLPWLVDYYYEMTGRELTPRILFDRLHKMFYIYDKVKRKGRLGIGSREHVLNSEYTRRYHSAISGFVFSKNRDALTFDNCFRLGVKIHRELVSQGL
jgi:hypothetical protein